MSRLARAVGFAAAAMTMVAGLAISRPAHAIPAFARKYQTSCLTCHTIYPKLNPFGEAFRRNGYRFPTNDEGMTKEQTIKLGAEAYKKVFPKAVWPGTLPGSIPLAFGVNGQVSYLPKSSATDKATVDAGALVDEAHLWAGGSFDDKATYFAELTAGADGIEVEHAQILFNDLFGPAHAVNLVVGKGMPTQTSFGMHSSYISDMATPGLMVSALYGRDPENSWMMAGDSTVVEFNGVLAHRFDWSLGLANGVNADPRVPQDVYGHVGYKIGGVNLDGEGATAKNPMKPWAENALTLDVAGEHSSSEAADGSVDNTIAVSGGIRAQYQSLELDAGIAHESHDNVDGAGLGVQALSQWDELSYIVYPWLVPALRFEYTLATPSDGSGPVSDMRITPGIDTLIRANIKLTLSGSIEHAKGMPPAGWDGAMGMAAPDSPTATVGPEVESVSIGLAYAY